MRTFSFMLAALALSIFSALPSVTSVLAQEPLDKTKSAAAKERERVGSVLGKDVFRDELAHAPPSYSDAVQLFIAPVLNEFHQKHGHEYESTDEEIRLAVDWATEQRRAQGGEKWAQWQADGKRHQEEASKRLAEIEVAIANPETSKDEKELYRTALRVSKLEATHPHATEMWFLMKGRKFEQYLYKNYGCGRIILQQLGPEALDAQHKLIRELEKEGKFEITDLKLRKLAYDYWERPKHPGGFHTDPRHLAFPWTKEHQELTQEMESGER